MATRPIFGPMPKVESLDIVQSSKFKVQKVTTLSAQIIIFTQSTIVETRQAFLGSLVSKIIPIVISFSQIFTDLMHRFTRI
jgi:hypothetical protein